MLLEIDDNKRVSDLQDKFSECFPNLKIEFYQWGYKWKAESADQYLINPFSLIENLRKKHEPGILQIRSDDKTRNVEESFRENFDLNVQIFRLHKGIWVATTGTDDLTIRQQMELAQAANVPIINPQTSDDDENYDLRTSI